MGCGDEPDWGPAQGRGRERTALLKTAGVGDNAVDGEVAHVPSHRSAVATVIHAAFAAVVLTAALVGVVTLVEVGPARATDLPRQVFGGTTVPPRTAPATRPSPLTTAANATEPTSIPTQTTAPSPSTVTPATAGPTTPVTAARAVVPPQSYAPATYPRTTAVPATAAPTIPATTIAPIGNSLPVSPVTLPLRTKGSNAHVNPVFAILSGIGFFIALLIVIGRLIITRPGGPDRRPVPADPGPADPGPANLGPANPGPAHPGRPIRGRPASDRSWSVTDRRSGGG